MNYPAYIAHMEALTGRRLPALYHRLAADGMLDWGTGAPDWYKTTYPRLLTHPPLLFIGNDFEIPAADKLPPEIDDDLCFTLKPAYRHRFIAFGQSGAGDAYAFAYLDDAAAEPCIACIYHDDNSRLLAADLHDFIYIMLLQANRTWGSEDDDDATYRAKLYAQLESHRPYLKPAHYDNLHAIYARDFIPIHYGRGGVYTVYRQTTDDEEAQLIATYAPFARRGETFDPFEA